jgi:A/G-specific adenine glycosylase
MMDLGATICTPKQPACSLCPWNKNCAAHSAGAAELFPVSLPKRDGALRRGAAFVAQRTDDFVLLRTRPSRGLLGGMAEVPTTPWSADFDESKTLEAAPRFVSAGKPIVWRKISGVVRHVFTHFPLELAVYRAEVPRAVAVPDGMRWIAISELGGEALPSVMRKVVEHGLGAKLRRPPSA